MRRMLEELSFGNLSPEDQYCIKDSKYGKAAHIMPENEYRLTERLDGKKKELLIDLINAQSREYKAAAVENLIHGLRLNARIELRL